MIPKIPSYHAETYEQDQLIWLADLLRELDRCFGLHQSVLIDVGANRGKITQTLLSCHEGKDCEFVCLEPNPDLYLDLKNQFAGRTDIQILPFVAHDRSQSNIPFNVSRTRPGLSYVQFTPTQINTDGFEQICCEAISVDDVMKPFDKPCSFIKIDAEGHDFKVLQGARATLQKDRPVVLFEFSGKLTCEAYDITPMQWFQFFENNQYELIAPVGGHDKRYILSHFGLCSPELVDLLAVPREKFHVLKTA
jgi:FkbM family methyltransferase